MNYNYSEPYKEKSLWYVNKINSDTGKTLKRLEFSSKVLADAWLDTIHVYINGELLYSGN